MKNLIITGALLSLTFLFAACSGEEKKSDTEKQNSNPQIEQESLDIEHEIDAPFLYPFGLELKQFTAKGYRSRCAGDCCVSSKAINLGEYTIFADTVDCGDYGYTYKYLLFRGEQLIAVHQKESSLDVKGSEDHHLILTERTIDFENEKTYARRDTFDYQNVRELTGDFTEEMFDRSERSTFKKKVDDPREYYNFESNEDFSLLFNRSEGELRPIRLINNFNPNYDIEVLSAYSMQDIQDFKSRKITKEALFAYSTWWAGGGEIIYGILNEGVLQIYYSYEDEMLADIPEYELLLEVDPDVTKEKPDHYIVYNPEKGKNRLMIGFNEKDEALYAKYEGQSRHIALEELADKSKGKKIVKVYQELIHGIANGTYTLTHEGIYDYVTYKGKNGKEVKFTIDHEHSVQGSGGYRDRPLF